jgi:hypothetical protein
MTSFYVSALLLLCLDDETKTAVTFNAAAHVKLFEQTFKHLQFDDVSDFAMCQVSDSTNLNPKIADDLGIFHVACRNHCLNLACKEMEANDSDLQRITEKTQEIHRSIKASNKLTAELENIQASAREIDESAPSGKVKLSAPTRWNSVEGMLASHDKHLSSIRDVIELYPDRLSDETVSQCFMTEIKNHLRYLTEIKKASANMQATLATLEECQFQVDSIGELAKSGYSRRDSAFKHCK